MTIASPKQVRVCYRSRQWQLDPGYRSRQWQLDLHLGFGLSFRQTIWAIQTHCYHKGLSVHFGWSQIQVIPSQPVRLELKFGINLSIGSLWISDAEDFLALPYGGHLFAHLSDLYISANDIHMWNFTYANDISVKHIIIFVKITIFTLASG